MPGRDIVVIGASAGGVEALSALARALPARFPAAVYAVQHLAPYFESRLAEILDRAGPLPAVQVTDGAPIVHGRIHVAPPDHHVLLESDHCRVVRGPKENRVRPSVDALFRSAAYVFGPRVVGVILTGRLDDGVSGLWAIKQRGGVAVVQHPHDAAHDGMPRSALLHVDVDYTVPLAEIGPLLVDLTREAAEAQGSSVMSDEARERLEIETRISKDDQAYRKGVHEIGSPSEYACPDCHGVLFQIQEGGIRRFRCRTGHAYSNQTLMTQLAETAEDALWSGLRALEEVEAYARDLAANGHETQTDEALTRDLRERADLAARHVQVIRHVLQHYEKPEPE
jgi:two-component system chemotaxis response regulator CheB